MVGQVHLLVYYIKLKSRPSDRQADISAVSAVIETELVLKLKAGSSGTSEYIFISLNMPVFIHKCAKGSGVSQNSQTA